MEVAGEATVYVHLGSFHKPVKCYVMDMLYEVDLILGEAFMLKYNCILHYGKGCIMIQKGKRHMTVIVLRCLGFNLLLRKRNLTLCCLSHS
jgi:hypothetical protein